MAARQKPKSDTKRGIRNSERRNGKAFKKRPENKSTQFPGRTVCGYSIARVNEMAKNFGLTYDVMAEQLKVRRNAKRHMKVSTGYKGRLLQREVHDLLLGALVGIPLQRKSDSFKNAKLAKRADIKRLHDWYPGEPLNSHINMRCKRNKCGAIWFPWQTEVTKGECKGVDVDTPTWLQSALG